jgi:hypothetical protein
MSLLVNDKHAYDESWYFYDAADAEVQELVTMELRGGKQNSEVAHTVSRPTKRKRGSYECRGDHWKIRWRIHVRNLPR